MNITVVGAGYVGLVTAVCFAELGNNVTCVDIDEKKISSLRKAILPVYEPGLESMLKSALSEGRLHFVTAINEQNSHPKVIFIAVGTPEDTDGSADMRYVLNVAKSIGESLHDYCVVVDKSTVPVGVADQVASLVKTGLEKRGVHTGFDVVSNPEFLREGGAIDDFMNPDRVVVGLNSDKAREIMRSLYAPILRHPEKLYFMSVRDAEMTKYAANAMLATRISFMNEMSILCEKMSVDIEKVRLAIGADLRIGSQFLNAGCGYGGSCFPKDVKALIKMAESCQLDPILLRAVETRNVLQKQLLIQKIIERFGNDLTGIRVGVWGLSFKPETDDMREAPAIVLIEALIDKGAIVYAYDPAAMPVAEKMLPKMWFESGDFNLASHQYEALTEADALVLVTEWKSFKYPDLTAMAGLMKQKIIFDGRNLFNPSELIKAGFEYCGVGRSADIEDESGDVNSAFLDTLTYE